MAKVAVRIGKAATIRRLEASDVQQKMGMRMSVMPGARILSIVVTKLTPVRSVPMPEICKAHR